MQNFPGQLPHQGYPPQPPHIPYNAVPPAPPAIPSIAAPTITLGPYAPTPSILPGPFILLLLLPAIPLLLFSLGARPPDTSHLPFTTSDVFTTGAFVTVTMTIVICLGVYPEAGGAVWAWIREGANGEWDMRYWNGVKSWTGMATTTTDEMKQSFKSVGSVAEQVQMQSQMQWRWKYVFDERYRRWTKVKVKVPILIEQEVRSENSHIRPNPKGFQALSTKHLSALRKTFPDWYSEFKPKLLPSLLVIGLIVFLMILLTGQILGSAYDTESSGEKRESSSSGNGSGGGKMSSWVEMEIRKRKEEKSHPEKTLKRIKEEGKKELEGYKKKGKEELKKFQRKREAEKELLKKELKKRGLPLVGLEDKNKDKEGKKEKKKKDDDDQEDDGKGERQEGKSKSKSDKMKKLLLGEKGSTKKNAEKEDEKAGPGWEIADNALAQNTLAQSQMNAQQMAEKLKGGG